MNNIEAHTTTIKLGEIAAAHNKRYLVVEDGKIVDRGRPARAISCAVATDEAKTSESV